MKNVVLIGDSIRMGYQETVRAELSGWADVWGPIQNGGTSENVLIHLDEWAIRRQPDVLHVNCGLHDLRKEFGVEAAAVPLQKYAENVRIIMNRMKTETKAFVIWALTTPVNQSWHRKSKPFDRFETDVTAYNAVALDIARQTGIIVNDLFATVTSAGRDNLLIPDGVHFKPMGYTVLGKTVADCIRKTADKGPSHTVDTAS
jgi:lysophospholipase L1-like esterase